MRSFSRPEAAPSEPVASSRTMNADPPTPSDSVPPEALPPDSRAEATPPPRRRRRAPLLIAAALVAIGAVVAFGYEPLVRYLVKRETQRLGFVIAYDTITLHDFFSNAVLRGVRVELDGVRGLHADLDEVSVDLDRLKAKRLAITGLRVRIEGSAADRLLDLGAWSNGHPDLYRVAGEGRGVAVTWSAAAGEAPWLALSDGALSSNGTDATFHTPTAILDGFPLGAVGAAWSNADATITLGLGNELIAAAPIHVELRPLERPATLSLTLRPIRLEALGAPLGLVLPAPGALAEGNAKLALGDRAGHGAIEGTASFTLTGWVPPHPRELGGIVFGDHTTFNTRLAIAEDHRKVTLSETAMTAGALKLKGGGTVDRYEGYALSSLDLKGSLACSDVARSAVASSWGDLAGQLAFGVAQVAMTGSVGIKVHVEADTRALTSAKLTHEVGVGCGLRVPKLF